MTSMLSTAKRNKIGTVASLVASLVLIFYLSRHLDGAENLIRSAGWGGPILAILIYGLLSLTPISTDPLTLVSGALFGPFIGVLVSWMGNNLASFLEYFAGRAFSAVADFDEKRRQLPFRLGELPADSPYFLIFARFIPAYGGKIVSFVAGVYHVPLFIYTWTTVLTNFFGALLLSLGGYSLLKIL